MIVMMTSSNGNIFLVTGNLCGEFTGSQWNPHTKKTVTRNFDVFFDLRPKKLLSKQSWGWWFETPSRPLWRHRNVPFLMRQSCKFWSNCSLPKYQNIQQRANCMHITSHVRSHHKAMILISWHKSIAIWYNAPHITLCKSVHYEYESIVLMNFWSDKTSTVQQTPYPWDWFTSRKDTNISKAIIIAALLWVKYLNN